MNKLLAIALGLFLFSTPTLALENSCSIYHLNVNDTDKSPTVIEIEKMLRKKSYQLSPSVKKAKYELSFWNRCVAIESNFHSTNCNKIQGLANLMKLSNINESIQTKAELSSGLFNHPANIGSDTILKAVNKLPRCSKVKKAFKRGNRQVKKIFGLWNHRSLKAAFKNASIATPQFIGMGKILNCSFFRLRNNTWSYKSDIAHAFSFINDGFNSYLNQGKAYAKHFSYSGKDLFSVISVASSQGKEIEMQFALRNHNGNIIVENSSDELSNSGETRQSLAPQPLVANSYGICGAN